MRYLIILLSLLFSFSCSGQFIATAFHYSTDTAFWPDTAFLPAGVQLWLDGFDVDGDGSYTSGQPAADAAVSNWDDKSANDNDAVQITGTKQPLYRTAGINGRPGIDFDGTDDGFLLQTTITGAASEYTAFFVLGADDASHWSNQYILDAQTGRFVLVHLGGPGGTKDQVSYFDGTWRYIANAASGAQYLYYVLANGTGTGEVFRDGVSLGTADFVSIAGGGTVGLAQAYTETSSWYDGDMGEGILWTRILTASEIGWVKYYIRSKWGL